MKTFIALLLLTSVAGAKPKSVLAQSDSAALFNQALKYYNSADYRKARSLFEELDRERGCKPLDYYLGVCSFQMGDYKKALDYLSEASAGDSLFPLARYYQAETMIALRNPTAAVEYLQESLSRDSAYEPARLEMVKTLCDLGKFKEAEVFIGDRGDYGETLSLCQGLLGASEYDEAHPFLANLVSRDSTNALAKLMLAETCYQTKKYTVATVLFSSLLSDFGQSPFVIRRLSLCYGKMGGKANLETAISLMDRYFDISRDTSSENIGYIGTWYYDLSRFDSAEVCFRRAVELNSSDPQAQLNLGLALMRLGKLHEAIESMSLAYSLSKSSMTFSLSILKSLAAAELREKEYSEAVRNYRLILQIDPNDGEAVYGLGLAYDQSGEARRAVYWYRKYVAMKTAPDMNMSFRQYARHRLDKLSAKSQ